MTEQVDYEHPIKFIPDRCKGCTHCLRACPTEAIRVKNGTAQLIEDKCIACGECIRVCPNNAIVTTSDSLTKLDNYEYQIAIPTSPYFGQFGEGVEPSALIQALLEIGFDEVYEEAVGAEALTYAIRKELGQSSTEGNSQDLLISTACPAIIRLIQVKFPSLTENLVRFSSPTEVTASLVLNELTEVDRDRIGIFSIAPCPAQVTAARAPVGRESSQLDGVISIEEVYNEVMQVLPDLDGQETSTHSSVLGLNWGRREGEIEAVNENHRIIAVDGVRAVNRILTELEEGRLQDVEYVEVRSCVEGCAGGVLTSEDPPITKYRLQSMDDDDLDDFPFSEQKILDLYHQDLFTLNKPIESRPTLHLHDDLQQAITIMEKAEEIMDSLPGLDCAACGSPTCQAFAEDVAKGEFDIWACPLLDKDTAAVHKEDT